MSREAKREYLRAIKQRYRRANKRDKHMILNEFCSVCGHHRKHAIRLLNTPSLKPRKRPGPSRTYDKSVEAIIKQIWLKAEQCCSKILKQVLVQWLPYYERHYAPVPEDVRQKLYQISPATIDRLLKPIRERHQGKGLCGTRPGSIIRTQVPVRDCSWQPDQPGYLEVDTVAHCGGSLEGDFVWSITFTDILTQWTINKAIWNKGSQGVVEQVENLRQELPFPLKGFHVDNGSEFMNYHLIRYFSSKMPRVVLTRCRPNKSNDNAHVEQKNWTHVRALLGYDRIDIPQLIPDINELYRYWGYVQNFFQPKLRLISKTRVGAKRKKRYDTPATPYQRIMLSQWADDNDLSQLMALQQTLDPFALKKTVERKLDYIFRKLR